MSKDSPRVWGIVTTFNGKRFLEPCFRTLLATDYPNLSLLLVDNGSTDDSVSFVQEHFPQVQILSLPHNHNIGAAYNRGIRRVLQTDAHARYICVFNDDIEAPDTRWLSDAVTNAENDPRLGIVGFAEVNPPDKVTIPQHVTVIDVDYLDGFAILVRRSLFESIGMFDETYQGASDEDDLEARALRAGFQMKQVSTPFFHHAGGTRKQYRLRSGYLQMRDGIRFSIKNRNLLRAAMRVGRILDVACNPWPRWFDPEDKAHQRMRYGGNRGVNFLACCAAVIWNGIHLPGTLLARHSDEQRIREFRQRCTQGLSESDS